MNNSKLRLICVGTGRDGTTSLAHMIQEIYDRGGSGRVQHEYRAREFYDAYANYQETKDVQYLAEIHRMIDGCPYECIVGNGYASILPIVAERLGGSNIALIHLRRADRNACVESLKRNSVLFPGGYRYYAPGPDAVVKRMAAFHFDEMTETEWDGLTLDQKLRWYYDKTHDLVEASRNLFQDCLEIRTEDLTTFATREALSRFVSGAIESPPAAVHLNTHFIDVAAFPPGTREKMHDMLGKCDLFRLARDEVYSIEYFSRWFVQWSNHEVGKLACAGARKDNQERAVASMLERARDIAIELYQNIEALQALPELCGDCRPPRKTMMLVETESVTAAAARIGALEAALEAERASAAARIDELEAAIEADRTSAAAHVAALEAALEAGRASAAARIAELETVLDAGRAAAAARIGELEAALEADRASASARIGELEAELEAGRVESAARISQMEATLEAERLRTALTLADMRTLQSTLSWRITAPLRAVRRTVAAYQRFPKVSGLH